MAKGKQVFDEEMRKSLAASLQSLRDRKPIGMTRRGLIDALKEEIRLLRKEGFSFAEIAETLTQAGLEIAPSTLREYSKKKTVKIRKNPDKKREETTVVSSTLDKPNSHKQVAAKTSAAFLEDA